MERQFIFFAKSRMEHPAVPSGGRLFQLNINCSASLLNGMISVGDQVHHDLMHLRGICGDQTAIRVDSAFDFNLPRYRCPSQFQYLFQNGLNPDGQFLGVGLTAESQNLFDQITAPLRGFINLFDAFMRMTVWWNFSKQHL